MRILHININYVGTRLFQKMMQYFRRPGAENIVFSPVCKITEINITPDGDEIIVDCFNKRDRYIYSYKQGKIFRALLKNVDVKSVDICHTYTVFSDGNSAYRLRKKLGIPYVVTVRDTDINTFFKKLFWLRGKGNRILANAGAVVFLSPAYKKLMLEEYIKPALREKISEVSHIIPNGVDEFWHENTYTGRDYEETEERLARRELRIVFVGLLNFRKNIEAVKSAVEVLVSRGWNAAFTVVGKIVNQEVYDNIIRSEYINYTGELDKEGVMREYRNADVFVMPSLRETFGLTYAEAMTQGLPLIYTKGQGFDGQFADGEVGYSVDPHSAEDIADKIEMICGRYREISENCLRGSKRFDWQQIADRYFEIYHSIRQEDKNL